MSCYKSLLSSYLSFWGSAKCRYVSFHDFCMHLTLSTTCLNISRKPVQQFNLKIINDCVHDSSCILRSRQHLLSYTHHVTGSSGTSAYQITFCFWDSTWTLRPFFFNIYLDITAFLSNYGKNQKPRLVLCFGPIFDHQYLKLDVWRYSSLLSLTAHMRLLLIRTANHTEESTVSLYLQGRETKAVPRQFSF